MLHDIDLRKGAVFGLLIFHVIWIANHLRWVANDEINPWRLGGYAMYTRPQPVMRIQVFEVNSPDPIPVNTLQYQAATRFTNAGRTFRCAHIPSVALRSFFNENRNLLGRDLVFVYSERQFIHAPPSVERVLQGAVKVTWQDMQNFTFISRFCGKEHTESVHFVLG